MNRFLCRRICRQIVRHAYHTFICIGAAVLSFEFRQFDCIRLGKNTSSPHTATAISYKSIWSDFVNILLAFESVETLSDIYFVQSSRRIRKDILYIAVMRNEEETS